MLRYLRIAVSVVSGLCCVLVIVLWVRSCWWINQAQYRISSAKALVGMSQAGVLTVSCLATRSPIASSFYTAKITDEEVKAAQQSRWGLSLVGPTKEVKVPHWFAILITAAIAAVPWVYKAPRRFSLRSLLITTTIVALGLGLIIYATRG